MPALPRAWPRFARVLRLEAGVLAAVLVAAALLANGEPPAV
jgi:putative copper export protein